MDIAPILKLHLKIAPTIKLQLKIVPTKTLQAPTINCSKKFYYKIIIQNCSNYKIALLKLQL